jgi:hypothetical protein
MSEPVVVAEGPFEVIAYRVHRDGKPYIGGTWLRETAGKSAVVCKTCGPLPVDGLHGWTSDWHVLCRDAMDHVKETGHTVAVESWQGAVYGPEEDGTDAD